MNTAPIYRDRELEGARDVSNNIEVINKYNSLKDEYEVFKQNINNKKYDEKNEIDETNEVELSIKMNEINTNLLRKIDYLKKNNEQILKLTDYSGSISKLIQSIQGMESLYTDICRKSFEFQNNDLPSIFIDKANALSNTFFSYDKSNTYSLVEKKNIDNIILLQSSIDTNVSKRVAISSKLNGIIGEYKQIISNCSDNTADMNIQLQCTICYDDKISFCVTPCGHTFCKKCSDKMNIRCFTCNTVYKGKQKIFISGVAQDIQEDSTRSRVVGSSSRTLPFSSVDSIISSSGDIVSSVNIGSPYPEIWSSRSRL